jgi:predicted nucleotidyltransferase
MSACAKHLSTAGHPDLALSVSLGTKVAFSPSTPTVVDDLVRRLRRVANPGQNRDDPMSVDAPNKREVAVLSRSSGRSSARTTWQEIIDSTILRAVSWSPVPDNVANRVTVLRETLRRFGHERAILFGSAARGDQHEGSGLDVIVVRPTELPFVERPRALLEMLPPGMAVDVLVYTPA